MSLTWFISKPENVWLHFAWWFRCKLPGKGIKKLRLGAEASEQLILKTRLWPRYHSRGRAQRMAISSRWNGGRDEGNCGKIRWLLSTQEFPWCNMKKLQNKHKQVLLPDYKKRWSNRFQQFVSILIFEEIGMLDYTAFFFKLILQAPCSLSPWKIRSQDRLFLFLEDKA